MKSLKTEVKEILEKLENKGFKAYLVGGYVRDTLLSKTTYDIDICTNATTMDLMNLFTGDFNEYGSVRIKRDKFTIDITSFREEEEYQNRRPISISFTNSLKKDIVRRDFTINTICMDKEGKIIDLLNGKEDLKNKCIRAVGNPKVKIKEDPLRILRAIRLATLLDFSIEKELKREIKKNKILLKSLSSYRIKEEISKILLSQNYKKGLKLLKELSLCEELGLYFKNVIYTSNICGMWAQIQIHKNLPFTKKEKENIVKIRKILNSKKISLENLYENELNLIFVAATLLKINVFSILKVYENLPIHHRKDLQISYQEICTTLEVEPCQKVKEIEKELIQKVLYKRIVNNNKNLKDYLRLHKMRWFH